MTFTNKFSPKSHFSGRGMAKSAETRLVGVRLTELEAHFLNEIADYLHLPPSTFIRNAALAAAKRLISQGGLDDAHIQEISEKTNKYAFGVDEGAKPGEGRIRGRIDAWGDSV